MDRPLRAVVPTFPSTEWKRCDLGRADARCQHDHPQTVEEAWQACVKPLKNFAKLRNQLRSFDDEDRSRFLKFVWARERLPNSSAEFHQRFKIQAAVGDGPRDHPNTYLPKAHTCFFSLNLPKYDSDEVMKEKLLYAIYNCVEMDADFKLADSENSAWLAPAEGGGSEELFYA